LQALAFASIISFIGNEFIVQLRMKVGKEIGSAALIADIMPEWTVSQA
jgi:divalent metal cation (Fe/Co/Zn/Cd) transporter